jgi:hypothetical protein
MHKCAEGMETKIKLTGVQCCVSDESIHPEQQSASVLLVDELRRGSQVQCHPGGVYDQHRAQ